jgi:hypothetical protein
VHQAASSEILVGRQKVQVVFVTEALNFCCTGGFSVYIHQIVFGTLWPGRERLSQHFVDRLIQWPFPAGCVDLDEDFEIVLIFTFPDCN